MTKSKITRVIEKYNLERIGSELEDSWTGNGGERTSLRDLADNFNKAVIKASLQENGVTSLNFKIERIYEMITGENGAETTRVKRYLEREDIDPDELRSDFVTHQTIHTYLKNERNVNFSKKDDKVVKRKIETIEKLQGRVEAVTESTISSLVSAGELDQDGYEIIVDVRAVCSNCRSDYHVSDLFRNGGCGCDKSF